MSKVTIIAEAGVNHNGDMSIAKKLVEAAAKAGADYVKFQTFKTENVVTKTAKKAEYQTLNTSNSETQYEMIKRLELSKEMHAEIVDHCKYNKIKFLSTGFDLESLEFLNSIEIPLFKIPSGEITNLPYLRRIASFNKPIIMSTGMADMIEVRNALNVLISEGIEKKKITILHCNTEYPTKMEDVNLRAMLQIKKELDVQIGYSDHTLGIEVPVAAVAMGAIVIEKHFTVDKTFLGPDHRASLEPNELNEMVLAIRNIEKAISGSGRKEPSVSEAKNKTIVRKSIVASKQIKKGEYFTEYNITVKRPGEGISPMKWDEIIGKRAKKNFSIDDYIESDNTI